MKLLDECNCDVWYEATPFAQASLSQNLGLLR